MGSPADSPPGSAVPAIHCARDPGGFSHWQPLRSAARNMQSVAEHPEVIREYLAEECAQGRVLGPLEPEAVSGVHISRFGLIPKKTPGAWRLIVDLSSPEGSSVNDGIAEHLCSLRYMSVADALAMVHCLGRGCLLAKMDIQKAYWMVPVHPNDRMQWEGKVYVDGALPFGLRSAPEIFSAMADVVEWMARARGIHHVGHYLDDFLVAGHPKSSECGEAVRQLGDLFAQLGVPVAAEKTEGPASTIVFLGIEIDTWAMEIRLPQDKLRNLQRVLEEWSRKQHCCRWELESLLGLLGHACCVVVEGRTFLRRLFELLAVARKPHHYVRLNLAARSDLCWWQAFLAPLNHRALRHAFTADRPSFTITTDASGAVGCGAVWHHWWLQLKWSEIPPPFQAETAEDSITMKELLPIVLAVGVWGPWWKGGTVLVLCDNQGATAAVNSGHSKAPRMMHLLRSLFFIKARFQLRLLAAYLPGRLNVTADAVSRDHLPSFFAQIPCA